MGLVAGFLCRAHLAQRVGERLGVGGVSCDGRIDLVFAGFQRAEIGGMEMILVKNCPKGDSDKENDE